MIREGLSWWGVGGLTLGLRAAGEEEAAHPLSLGRAWGGGGRVEQVPSTDMVGTWVWGT